MGGVEKATQRLMSSIPEADKTDLYAPGNVEILVSSIREGLVRDSRGVAQDDVLVNQEWGFDLKRVKPRIDIWHGEADVNVPLHAGKYLYEILPNTRAFFLPGAGHFFLLGCWEEVLSTLVNDKGES